MALLDSSFVIHLRVSNVAAARRLFGESLGWSLIDSEGQYRSRYSHPGQAVPMLELSETAGAENFGFYCIHIEVDKVDDYIPKLRGLELVGPGREERPPGRDLYNVRWSGWSYYLAIFAGREPYWGEPMGLRCTVIGGVPDLSAAERVLSQHGWRTARTWSREDARGTYLAPPGGYQVEVDIESAGTAPEGIVVDVNGPSGGGPEPGGAVAGLTIGPPRSSS